jgi:hypothetical protein
MDPRISSFHCNVLFGLGVTIFDHPFPQSDKEAPMSRKNAQTSLKTRDRDLFDLFINENFT